MSARILVFPTAAERVKRLIAGVIAGLPAGTRALIISERSDGQYRLGIAMPRNDHERGLVEHFASADEAREYAEAVRRDSPSFYSVIIDTTFAGGKVA